MAYSRLLFFSLTRYTLPTSPLPINLILSKLEGPTSTFLTLMELELYVRRKASDVRAGAGSGDRPSGSGTASAFTSVSDLVSTRPRVLAFLFMFTTSGSLPSSAVAGRSPLPLPLEKRPWALGALATLLSFRASSSLVAAVGCSTGAPLGPSILSSGVSGGLGGTEPSL